MLFTFAELLRSYRHRASLDQAVLAAALGVHRNTLGRWEQGDYRPRSHELIQRLAVELALSAAETELLLRSAEFPAAQSAVAQPAARHQLRPPVADFVGRARETAYLVATLRAALAQSGATVISAVQGMGGVGKTELAYAVAHQLRSAVPDAQLLLDLHGSRATPLTASQALRAVIRVFHPDEHLPDDVPSLQQLYRGALHGQRALILADDACDASQVQPLMPPAGCALLVTSRTRFTLPGMTAIHLEPLGEAAAVTLLQRVCSRLSIAEAQALARACGQLPLALRISSGILRNDMARAVPAYLQQLTDQRQRLVQLRDPDDPQLDVAASLALSYAQLDAAARRVFRQLGVLVADFATELAVAVVEDAAGLDVEAVLHHLLRRNLLLYDTARSRWRQHDLVRDLAWRYLEAAGELDATAWRYARAAVQIAEETQAQYQAGSDNVLAALARFDAERPHIDAARLWATAHTDTAAGDALLLADAQATMAVGSLRYAGRRERLPQLEAALGAACRLGDRRGEGIVRTQLGWLYHFLGDAGRAIACYEQARASAQAIADHLGEGEALNNLGVAYAELGDIPRAIPYFAQRLAIARGLGDRFGEGRGLCNLGLVYLLVGDARQAQACLEAALGCFRTLGSVDGEATALGNLGRVYLELGDARQAQACLEAALGCFRMLGHRGGEASVLTDLGRAYVALGDAGRAIVSCASAGALFRELGAPREEGEALRALGAGYAALGDRQRTRATFEVALARLCAVDDQRGAAACRWEFGQALAGWGERERALPLLRAALAYEQEIGHAKAAEHAALVARLEAAAAS
jgi:tetratricopeptide (TPR) repeat protein/transcriptional regulator with XRE-family HTH domain